MNSRKIIRSIGMFLLFAVLLIGSVAALQEDFDILSSFGTIEQCSCSVNEVNLILRNTGDITSNYHLELGGEASEWANIAPSDVIIESGQEKEITVFVAVPCSARGEFTLETQVSTLLGLSKTFSQTLKTDNCPNVQIVQKSAPSATDPCQPINKVFEVKNTGKHTEAYRFGVYPYSEFTQVSTDIIVLEAGQSAEIQTFTNLPCDVYGTQEFTFAALAENAKILGELDFEVYINQAYDYALDIGSGHNVCQFTSIEVPVTVNNTADITNEYSFSLIGPLWAEVNPEPLYLWGQWIEQSTLTFAPSWGDLGTHNVTVTAMSSRGDEGRAADASVFVENCFDHEIILQDYQSTLLPGDVREYGFLINNLGTRDITTIVNVAGPEWVTFDNNQTVTVPPQQNVELTIYVEAPFEPADRNVIDITVDLVDSIDRSTASQMVLDIKTPEDAYSVDIPIELLEITYAGVEFDLDIQHTGTLSAVYDLGLMASPWVTMQESSVVLAPGESKTVHLSMYPDGELVLPDSYLVELSASVRGSDVVYVKSFNVDLMSAPLWLKAWRSLTQNMLVLLLAITTLMILVGLVVLVLKIRSQDDLMTSKVNKPLIEAVVTDIEKEPSNWWIFVVIGLLIAGMTAGGLWFTLSGSNTEIEDNTTVSDAVEPVDGPVLDLDESVEEEPLDEPVLTEDDVEESLITVDTSAVESKGDTLIVRSGESFILPVSVTNPTEKDAVFAVSINNDESWITSSDTVLAVPYGSSRTLELTITPDWDVLENNDYGISVEGKISGEAIDYLETLNFDISKKKALWEIYPFWIIVGIALAVLGVFLMRFFSRRSPVALDVDAEEDYKDSVIWKLALKVIAIIVIISGIIIGGYLAYDMFKADSSIDASELSQSMEGSDEAVELVSFDQSVTPGNTLTVSTDDPVEIPILITNPTDGDVEFKLIGFDEDWVHITADYVEVNAGELGELIVVIAPDMSLLTNADYMLSLDVKLESDKIIYEQTLELVVTKKNGFMRSYVAYALVGIVLLILVVGVIEGIRRFKGSTSDPVEVKPSTKTTKIRRTAIKLNNK